jgi:hypothetical protein
MPFVRLSARGVRQFRKEQSGNQLRRRPGFGVGNMPDVDWLALWVEFAQATDNKQIEVAERIVYFDGRLDFSQLSRSTLLAAARQIIRERVGKI